MGHLRGVGTPAVASAVNPLLQHGLDLGQINKDMVGRLNHGLCLADHTLGFFQFNRIEQFATGITLISFGVSVVTQRTNTTHKAISQGSVTLGAETLLDGIFQQEVLN